MIPQEYIEAELSQAAKEVLGELLRKLTERAERAEADKLAAESESRQIASETFGQRSRAEKAEAKVAELAGVIAEQRKVFERMASGNPHNEKGCMCVSCLAHAALAITTADAQARLAAELETARQKRESVNNSIKTMAEELAISQDENVRLATENEKLRLQLDGCCDGCGEQLDDAFCAKCKYNCPSCLERDAAIRVKDEALERIADPQCGCRPKCQCLEPGALSIFRENSKALAQEALSATPSPELLARALDARAAEVWEEAAKLLCRRCRDGEAKEYRDADGVSGKIFTHRTVHGTSICASWQMWDNAAASRAKAGGGGK